MKTQALIFDIDGTLWDSRALVAEGYNLQLRSEGLEGLQITAQQLTPLFGKMMWEIGEALFESLPEEERYPLMERCMARENAHLAQSECNIGYPEVAEVLEKLAKKYRLFIVSNCQKGYPELCMEKLKIAGFVEDHLCHGDTGTAKGETIRALMERRRISSAVYIGDTQGDYLAAKDAGIPFVWASYGLGTPERYDARIDSPRDLLQLFM